MGGLDRSGGVEVTWVDSIKMEGVEVATIGIEGVDVTCVDSIGVEGVEVMVVVMRSPLPLPRPRPRGVGVGN